MKSVTIYFILVIGLFSNPSAFDNLSTKEITRFKELIRSSGKFSNQVRFSILAPKEPNKDEVLAGKVRRTILGSLFEPSKNTLYHVEADLKISKILSLKKIEGAQPPISPEDFERLSKIVREDPQWRKAVLRRGFKNLDELYVDGWAAGLLSPEERNGNYRLMRSMTYYHGSGINAYARPLEGLLVTVDLNSGKVISLEDTEGIPMAKGLNEFRLDSPRSKKLKQIHYTSSIQKQSNLKLEGQKVKWLNWEFFFNFHPMHGLQLYRVQYRDKEKLRSVLYKLSLAEMVVPYGDSAKNWRFRNAFDVGEYGLGLMAHSFIPGAEVPTHAKFFDFVHATESGDPSTVQNAVAIYERSNGILWTHLNMESKMGHTDSLKNQELVLSFMSVVGNYDYGISYIFGMDGSIEVQAQLTGILLPKGSSITEVPCHEECLPIVEKNILAPPHQHFFNFRIDLDIDSHDRNTPVEINTVPILDKELNPTLNAFEKTNTILSSEKEAIRNLDLSSSRMWKVQSKSDKNILGHPTGYMIMPGENSIPYLQEGSEILKRARFIQNHIWFTKYKDHEQTSAGDYPNQSTGEKGLIEYISDNESLEDTDVVMWYTLGVTHHPRPEEWPIMSVHKTGFKLLPVHFFNRNPSAP